MDERRRPPRRQGLYDPMHEHDACGVGFVARAEDVEGLARGVVRLLEDAPLRERFGRQARRHVEDRFSLEARVRALARIYEEVVGKVA